MIGAPQFESILSISRPSLSDRMKILHNIIKSSKLKLEFIGEQLNQTMNSTSENKSDCYISKSNIGIKKDRRDANENENANENMNANMSLWSVKVAEMTAGYLPGDLARLIRRAAGESN